MGVWRGWVLGEYINGHASLSPQSSRRLENKARVKNGGQIMERLLPIEPLSVSLILLGASKGNCESLEGLNVCDNLFYI